MGKGIVHDGFIFLDLPTRIGHGLDGKLGAWKGLECHWLCYWTGLYLQVQPNERTTKRRRRLSFFLIDFIFIYHFSS